MLPIPQFSFNGELPYPYTTWTSSYGPDPWIWYDAGQRGFTFSKGNAATGSTAHSSTNAYLWGRDLSNSTKDGFGNWNFGGHPYSYSSNLGSWWSALLNPSGNYDKVIINEGADYNMTLFFVYKVVSDQSSTVPGYRIYYEAAGAGLSTTGGIRMECFTDKVRLLGKQNTSRQQVIATYSTITGTSSWVISSVSLNLNVANEVPVLVVNGLTASSQSVTLDFNLLTEGTSKTWFRIENYTNVNYFAEVIGWRSILTSSEKASVESYLKGKWQISY